MMNKPVFSNQRYLNQTFYSDIIEKTILNTN